MGQTDVEGFVWVGGSPALDLCNTVVAGTDLLDGPERITEWLAAAGLGAPDEAPTENEVVRVRALRDALRTAFQRHDAPDIAEIVAEWLTATPGRLAIDRQSLQPSFCPDVATCKCLMVPVLLDALRLARDEIGRVRSCASERCSMLYLDHSRNGSRRWCSMERCGSRAKAHAYYERKRLR